jgi:purine-nucleoside phosphorylase
VLDIALRNGVYAGVLGPSYETPAEIRMLAWMGADAVGMSTVAEAAAAHASGARVAAISCITNLASGIGTEKLSHEEVLRTGRASSERFAALLEAAIPRIHRCVAS